MSPLASCEVGMGAGAHNAEVVGGDAVVHDVEVVGGNAVAHGVREGGNAGVVGGGDGVHGVEVEGGGGGVHGVGVEGDVVVHIVGVVVEVGGETVEVGVCKVHVQNAAQEGNKVQAGNDHWVKSRHLGHHGIAMQDKENTFLSKPVGSMVMIKP